MNNSKASLILRVVVGCFLLLLLVTYLVGVFSSQDAPLNATFAACRAKGWQDNDLGLTSSQIGNYGLVSTAKITLKSKNRPKTVRAELRNWLNLNGWQVVDYKEE